MNLKTSLCIALVLSGLLVCASSGSAQGINLNSSLQAEIIHDPSLGGMKAFTLTMPSGWQFQGTVIAAIGCNPPSPVFRAYSPDGLTEIRLLPSFSWQVESGDRAHREGLGVPTQCIHLNGTMTAAQFLDRYVQALGPAHVVGPTSISPQYRRQLHDLLEKANTIKPQDTKLSRHTKGDAAALRIETANGTFIIEQMLRARVVCTLWSKAIAGSAGQCSARLDVLRAPKGQLDELVNVVDSHNLTTAKNDDSWLDAVIAKMKSDDQGTHFDPYIPNRAAVRMPYRQAHDFGLSDEERRRLIDNLNEHVVRPLRQRVVKMPRPSNVTSDWADFALDTAPAIDDRGIVHISQTVHAWSSSNEQRYQTDDPGANPNGVLTGSWTETGKSAVSLQ